MEVIYAATPDRIYLYCWKTHEWSGHTCLEDCSKRDNFEGETVSNPPRH